MSTTAGRWTKLYGSLVDGEALVLSRDARLLGIEAEAWADDNETDGRIPRNALRRITDADDPLYELVDALLAAGRWTETGAGWEIVGFLDRHDDADRRASERERHATRQRNFGRHTRGDHGAWCPTTCRYRVDGVNDGVIDKVQRDAQQREASRTGIARSAPSPLRGSVASLAAWDGATGALIYDDIDEFERRFTALDAAWKRRGGAGMFALCVACGESLVARTDEELESGSAFDGWVRVTGSAGPGITSIENAAAHAWCAAADPRLTVSDPWF